MGEEEKKIHPLWLPEGSIRAVIALGVIGTACGVGILTGAVPEFLATLAAAIGAFYFGTKA